MSAETDAISYTRGVLDGIKKERERIKAEVDKLTVIDTYPSVEFKAEVKSQLQHDKQTLLDLMGE